VLHDQEWTYSVVAGLDLLPGGVSASYRALSDALILALNGLGLNPELQRHQTKSDSAVCFDTPAFAELTVNNKKVSGSAQTRSKHALLQHGSIPLEFPWKALAIALKLSQAQVRLLKRQAAGLAELDHITLEQLRDALVQGFESQFGPMAPDVLTSKEKNLADQLAKTKYARLNWSHKEAVDVARR
jgi:lipoate-protein ligase A